MQSIFRALINLTFSIIISAIVDEIGDFSTKVVVVVGRQPPIIFHYMAHAQGR